MLQKAMELCAEVRSFGAALLAALEKKDAEHLSMLRATQETALLTAIKAVKQKQIDEANRNLEGLQKSHDLAQIRQDYYTTLLSAASTISLDVQAGPVDVNITIPIFPMSTFELLQLGLIAGSLGAQLIEGYLHFGGVIAHLLPEVSVSAGPPSVQTGGAHVGDSIQAMAAFMGTLASILSTGSSAAATMAGFERRAEEWDFQKRLAAKELEQIDKQMAAAQIRADIAGLELESQQTQIDNATAVEDFLREKFTTEDLYSWMVTQISTVYFQCYQLAYETAKKAEKAFRFERGLADSSYIQFGYWDSLKQGLLSGERMYLDLKRMEMAYLDLNSREYEISKNISLVLLDPLALIALKETGHCIVGLPEAFFDMDYPGHYMRRIKSVSLTIPCVTGPYSSVNCTMTLLQSKIRTDSVASSLTDYSSDSHFQVNHAATQSIATRSGQNDSGMFQLNFRDERYLPFEGVGTISIWQIDLPPENNAFDFETISDVIINLRYTARDGGDGLRSLAQQAAVMPAFALQAGPAGGAAALPNQNNLLRLFSLKHEFPSDWYKFLNPPDTATAQTMQIGLTMDRFPYQYRGKTIQISSFDLFLKLKDGTALGNYAAGAPLPISVVPPSGAVLPPALLRSASTLLNGTPFASISLPSGNNLGSWLLVLQGTDIQKIAGLSDGKNHLNPAVIDDVVAVCHFSAT